MRHSAEESPVAWDPIRRALEENEDWYRDLVEHSRDLLCVHDLEGRLLSVNPVPARLLGYTVEELLQKPMRDFIDPQFRAQFDAYLREIARVGQADGLLALLTRSGEQRIWEYHNTLRTEGVETPIVRGIAHDVTEQVQAAKALRATNEKLLKTARERERMLGDLTLFRTLLDQSNDAIEIIDPETLRFLDVNERLCIRLGYSREELLSMTIFDIDPSIDESLVTRLRQQLAESGFASVEAVQRRKDGTTLPVEVSIRRVQLDQVYSVAVSRDITARKRAEEALQASERRYRLLFSEMVVGFALIEPIYDENGKPCDFRYLEVNPAFETHSGLPREKVLGRTLREVLPTLDPCWFETFGKVATTGESIHFENYAQPLEKWFELITFRTHQGQVAVTFADITQRKRAEEALRQSEARLNEAQHNAHIGSWHYFADGTLIHSDEMYELYKLPRDRPPTIEFWLSAYHPEDRASHWNAFQRALESGAVDFQWEYRVVWPDGQIRNMFALGKIHRDHEGRVITADGTVQDVTERKQSERALKESEMCFRAVYERSPIGIALVDSRTGRLLQVNPKYCEIAGRGEEELVGIDVRTITHPDDVGHTSEYLRQLADEQRPNYEMDKRYPAPGRIGALGEGSGGADVGPRTIGPMAHGAGAGRHRTAAVGGGDRNPGAGSDRGQEEAHRRKALSGAGN